MLRFIVCASVAVAVCTAAAAASAGAVADVDVCAAVEVGSVYDVWNWMKCDLSEKWNKAKQENDSTSRRERDREWPQKW